MSDNIRRLAAVFTLAFAALAVYLTFWQVVVADEMSAKMPYNASRLIAEHERVVRGDILDRDGQRLAWTERDGADTRRVVLDPSLAHVVGYYSFRYGSTNLEAHFGDFLSAERGVDVLTAFRARFLETRTRGGDVSTTIDLDLQRAADLVLGDATGAIVALDPRTGAILAMVSRPTFDPNTIDTDWEALVTGPGTPLVNRAADGHYTPGSTFKIVTLAAALEAGQVTPATTFTNQGDLVVDGFRIKYANPPDRTTFDLADAFAFSVNASFAEIGLKLGADRLAETARRFGFDRSPPLEGIPTSPSHISTTPGFLRGRPALASTAFGQGELIATPLQMALMAAAVANGGDVPAPYLVAEVRDSRGDVVYRHARRTWTRAISPETARAIDAMMVHSVEHGYANTARIEGVKVGGKTGTAETGTSAEPHAWFVGYAPADDPTIAVAVICENAGPGSLHAAPRAKQVLETWLALGR